jgi:two-component system cell cycle response regulator
MISKPDIHNASILIVDDQQPNVTLIEEILRECGYVNISTTTDPGTVCELYRKNGYDLILLDLVMPGMDGYEVMEGLKNIEANGYIPVVVITGQQDQKLRALEAGAKDFVAKPFDLVEVQTRIHNMLEVRLLYKRLEHYSRELESLALYDALTGLPNRRLFSDRLSLAIVHANRKALPMAVMFLDLDNFKVINDTLSHKAGDILLGMVATRLVAEVREGDTVARLSGDEFVITLAEVGNADDVAMLASKLVANVSQPYIIHGETVNITASVGVGIYPLHGGDADTLLKSADLALHKAKHAGKNRYRFATLADSLSETGHWRKFSQKI